MSVWDIYQSRMEAQGASKRQAAISAARASFQKKMRDGAFFQKAVINGEEREVSIISGDALNIKTICALPGEDLLHGGIVEWKGFKWLITELDAMDEIYVRGKMQQCNHTLRWRGYDGEIIEKPAILEDATTYLSGENRKTVLTVGDGRFVLTVGSDSDTFKLRRGNRFLLGDPSADEVVAYEISKTNQFYNAFENSASGKNGIFRYIVTECAVTERDDLENRVADWGEATIDTDTDFHEEKTTEYYDEKKMWL